ncbi:uncharacterized protein LOC100205338 isoform X3 [Hydra vulgaris]|uniref:uncharacterized protein LOC100205338 isoform X3 n=1 Tax=Hydra vulgaris TaxID=6087 RepID=UPI001F5F5561|nr:uncharacterized protein LOC100205338 isoform X1 [Hydra vulgaris]XP_047135299.1 uncharacterized protein LOC100205338 isoform X1 [Hydra vulgaris]
MQQKAVNVCSSKHPAVNYWIKLRCMRTNNVYFVAPDGSKFSSTNEIAKFVAVMFGLYSEIETFLLKLQELSISKEIYDEDLSDLQATIKNHYANLFTEEKSLPTVLSDDFTNIKNFSDEVQTIKKDEVQIIEKDGVPTFYHEVFRHTKSCPNNDILTSKCFPILKNVKNKNCKTQTKNEVSKSDNDGGSLSLTCTDRIIKNDEDLDGLTKIEESSANISADERVYTNNVFSQFAVQPINNFKIKDPQKSKQRLVRMSPYFKKLHPSKVLVNTGLRGVHNTVRYTPTFSPFNLIQERLYMKPWQLLIATIFLNKTSATVALPLFWQFVSRFPTPNDVNENNFEEISALMKPLGLNYRRAKNIIQFSFEFLHKDWKYPRELYGIGKYGDDSYRMFCLGQFDNVHPTDNKLNLYKVWLKEHISKILP